mmetsp:Transcript_76332/g.147399  ORF Transcript_76332/g.147399 Transcript_76332/m.147399 type:complete len:172 (-) Transcript_76332:380-895(-)
MILQHLNSLVGFCKCSRLFYCGAVANLPVCGQSALNHKQQIQHQALYLFCHGGSIADVFSNISFQHLSSLVSFSKCSRLVFIVVPSQNCLYAANVHRTTGSNFIIKSSTTFVMMAALLMYFPMSASSISILSLASSSALVLFSFWCRCKTACMRQMDWDTKVLLNHQWICR